MSILLAGHYCHDRLLHPGTEHRVLGGTSAYGSAVLEALGVDFQVAAKVGPDFLHGTQVSRPPRVVPGTRTTSFVDDYRSGRRHQTLEAVCEPLDAGDVGGPFAIGIACGIAGEVGPDVLRRIRASSGIVLADAQSLLREGTVGELRLRSLPPEAAAQLDWLKASRDEAALFDIASLRGRVGIILTDGPRGSTLVTADAEVFVPAPSADEVDATGAGDCFLAGFAAALGRGFDPVRAAAFASVCGARAVEQIGVPRFSATVRAELRRAFGSA